MPACVGSHGIEQPAGAALVMQIDGIPKFENDAQLASRLHGAAQMPSGACTMAHTSGTLHWLCVVQGKPSVAAEAARSGCGAVIMSLPGRTPAMSRMVGCAR